MFEEGHVNNDQFIDTCKTNAASSGSDGCGIEEDKENCSDYGCRRNGIKVAIVHLATAKGTYTLHPFPQTSTFIHCHIRF